MFSLRSSLMLLSVAVLAVSAHAQTPAPVPTDANSQYGWLEGTVTNSDGEVVTNVQGTGGGKHLKGTRQGGGEFDVQCDAQMGGLYSVRNLRPGIYDITITTGFVGNTAYCPERIFGVVIKPGERTVLKIVMDQGDTYEEVGKPAVVSTPAINVTDELAQMHKQIDDLKAQVAALLKATSTSVVTTTTPGKP